VGRPGTISMYLDRLAVRCCPGFRLRFAWAPSLPPPKPKEELSQPAKRCQEPFRKKSPGTNLRRNPRPDRTTRDLPRRWFPLGPLAQNPTLSPPFRAPIEESEDFSCGMTNPCAIFFDGPSVETGRCGRPVRACRRRAMFPRLAARTPPTPLRPGRPPSCD